MAIGFRCHPSPEMPAVSEASSSLVKSTPWRWLIWAEAWRPGCDSLGKWVFPPNPIWGIADAGFLHHATRSRVLSRSQTTGHTRRGWNQATRAQILDENSSGICQEEQFSRLAGTDDETQTMKNGQRLFGLLSGVWGAWGKWDGTNGTYRPSPDHGPEAALCCHPKALER